MIYQIINISERYFKFETTTTVKMSNPVNIQLPSISVCWNLIDILNKSALYVDTGIRLTSNFDLEFWRTVENISISDYFKYTPANDTVLHERIGCSFRNSKSFALHQPRPSASDCYRVYNITKYIHRSMMCYLISWREEQPRVFVEEYALAPDMAGMIQRFFFDAKLFETVQYYSAYVHGPGTSKLFDSMFTPKRHHNRNSSGILVVDMTYSSVETTFLPAPYATKCRTVPGYESRTHLFFSDVRKKIIQKLKHIDSFTAIYKTSSYPLLEMSSLTNKTQLKILNGIIENEEISPLFCHDNYYVSRQTIGSGDYVTIGVNWPEDYFTEIDHSPGQLLIDYIVYICSSIGIWFGFSFCSLILPLQKCLDATFKENIPNTNQKISHPECNKKMRALLQYVRVVYTVQKSSFKEVFRRLDRMNLVRHR